MSIRFAYAVIGNLNQCPFYAYIGKFRTAFGNISTYSPFTENMLFHYFGGLGQGLAVGYYKHNLNIVLSALQGGPQPRAVNRGGGDGKVDNYALNAVYTLQLKQLDIRLGGGFLGGTSYCSDFPIKHFSTCNGNRNPAWDANLEFIYGDFALKGEIAQTTKVWPGTGTGVIDGNTVHVAPSKVTAFAIEGKYTLPETLLKKQTTLSVSYSEGIQGAAGVPWEFNKQLTAGISTTVNPYITAFAEYNRVFGFAPLQFMTGSDVPPTSTPSDTHVRENVYLIGLIAVI